MDLIICKQVDLYIQTELTSALVNTNFYNELKRKHLKIVCTPDVMCVVATLSVNKAEVGRDVLQKKFVRNFDRHL